MRISRCTTTESRRHSAGFTLLEVLVVMTLMAAISTLLIVGALRAGNNSLLRDNAGQLADVLALMNERSLFRGDLLALRLTPESWEPLRYNPDSGEFEPLLRPLALQTIDPSLALEWQFEEQRNRDQPTVAEAAEQLFADEEADSPPRPQLFFFPSGEVTPVQIRLREPDSGVELAVLIDSVGQISLQQEEEPL